MGVRRRLLLLKLLMLLGVYMRRLVLRRIVRRNRFIVALVLRSRQLGDGSNRLWLVLLLL